MLYMVSINKVFKGFYNVNEIKKYIIENNKNNKKFINEINTCEDTIDILWTLLFHEEVKGDYEFIEVEVF